MEDGEHPELDFDPLDDTKLWPRTSSRCCPVGRWCWTATRTTTSPRSSRSAFGTGVLVDGLDFSDDKMLQGRTFSYSDTQRYRVGPELPATADQRARRRRSTPTSATAR